MNAYLQIGLGLGLGLLVGLQRQRTESEVAGIRTFPLITVLGVLSGLLAGELGGWVVAAALVAVAALLVAGDIATFLRGEIDPGITTEAAALVMFSVGVLLSLGRTAVAVVVTGVALVLLQWKLPLHRLAERMGREDFRAVTRLALIGLVILPLLPDRTYGPYGVLNPFQIWLMVVLIVGISLAAYVAYKLLGPRGGSVAAGALGGLISSTAATIGLARRSGGAGQAAGAAVAIVIAGTIVFVRVLFEIAVVAPAILPVVGPPVAVMMLGMGLIAGMLFRIARSELGRGEAREEREPPSTLGAALAFGLLYAAVLFGVAWAKEEFGTRGMFVVAGLSGLTDMDAITLSTAQLVRSGDVAATTGWRLILVGGIANLVFKGAAVALLAQRRTRLPVGAAFAASIALGVALLWLWP